MRKSDILSLGGIKPTKEILEVSKSDIPEIKYYGNYEKEVYKYDYYYRAKVFGEILKVAIFSRDDLLRKKATNEIYISKKENKYLTYDTMQEKWRTAKIDRLHGWHRGERYYARDTEKTIISYLNSSYQRGYEAIYQFQAEIQIDKLKRTHRKITDRIDSIMELVPNLPKGFKEWAEETGMLHSRYIYYQYSRNVKEGYCTHCKQNVEIEKPRHNQEGKCSSCQSKITFKAIRKAAVVEDEGAVTILQKTREGFMLRYFAMSKDYKDYKNPEFGIIETIRTMYNNNFFETGKYEYAEFKNTGEIRWREWTNKAYHYSGYKSYNTYEYESILYTRNLKRILKDTELQYSAIEIFAKNILPGKFYPSDYISEYKRNKRLEYIVKLGFYKIAKELLRGFNLNEINRHGRRVQDVLKVPIEQIPMLIKLDPDFIELRVLQKGNTAGIKLNEEQIKWIAKNLGRHGLIEYMKYSTPHKVIRYIQKQSEGKKVENIAHDYYDYLDACEKLEYDLNNDFVFFPKNLKEAHDLTTSEWQDKKEQIDNMQPDEKNQLMEEIADTNVKKYAMKDKHFTVRIPWTCEEIKKEGQDLHHCVGLYADRVISKETVILFIRKNEEIDKPFYTMEIQHGEIKQVRGKNNCDTSDDVEKFIEKFKQKKLNKAEERIAS